MTIPAGSRRVHGRTVVITGGARGQGAAHARLLTREGARVVIADVLIDEGRSLASELNAEGPGCRFAHLDVTSEASWGDLRSGLEADAWTVDSLVNNAGIVGRGGALATSLDEWRRVFDVNVVGALLGIQTFAPRMKEARRGSIVNIVSMAAFNGYPGASYGASKWALRGLTKTAAMELAAWNVRVNAVHPGLVDTPMATNEIHNRAMVTMTPLGRAARTDEVSPLILFLVSDESSYITGADIAIDGGFTAGTDMRSVALATGALDTPPGTAIPFRLE